MKIIRKITLILILFITFPNKILAVDISVLNSPSIITDESFNVTLSITGPSDATNYLRVDLYKDGSTNYFGETFNGTQWYGGSEGKNYFPVQIVNSSASAMLQVRLGSPSPSEYSGSGEYKLKIRRYTSSGNVASSDNMAPVGVQINFEMPTPRIATYPPTQIPQTPIPTALQTQKPQATMAQSPTPFLTHTSLKTEFPSVSPKPEVLSQSTQNTVKSNDGLLAIPVVIISIGVLVILWAGYLAYKIRYNRDRESKN